MNLMKMKKYKEIRINDRIKFKNNYHPHKNKFPPKRKEGQINNTN
jgi:hypothetical protein